MALEIPCQQKIAILGGGMASLTTAFELTNQPDWQQKYDITLYQMGWRLGGKGASGRNRNAQDRIEEHGLHIFMGSYENTFKVMRQCYEELGRDTTVSLATWQEAFKPQNFIVLPEYINQKWIPWPFDFPANDSLPGEGEELLSLWGHLCLLIEFMVKQFESSSSSLNNWVNDEDTTHPRNELPGWLTSLLQEMEIEWQVDIFPVEISLLHLTQKLVQKIPQNPRQHQALQHQALLWLLAKFKNWLFDNVENIIETHHKFRRLAIVVDLVSTIVRGVIFDGLMFQGLDVIDDYDVQEWLTKHGATKYSVNSPLVRGLYDLVFSYENGNVERPNLAAGIGLRFFLRMLLAYKGAFFWKMQAGMGDTIFAPLYEVLRKRGVKFKFFHCVKNLVLSDDQQAITQIQITRQVTLKNEIYEPLVNIKDLPCWPSTPLYEQLVEGEAIKNENINLESAWTQWQGVEEITLHLGQDFDLVVLGISLGALQYICPKLIQARQEWQDMIANVKTVQTQALQTWLKPNLKELGWVMPSPVVDAYAHNLNTWADMSHLNIRESWDAENFPGSIAYFCGPLADIDEIPSFTENEFPEQQMQQVKQAAIHWFKENTPTLWPKITISPNSTDIDWNLLVDPNHGKDLNRFDAQFWRANIEPSERYVLALKGTTKYRLKCDQSGFDNLYLTGDWTNNGINIGSIEATVTSGMQASRAISGYPQKILGESDI
ncbi:NAD(P)-binding protein [Nostoc spongiaeforme FACHB-130]|uniref:NAD(P)-binding protein n=1 Tax=Nostoc spongiaeforme FACHB-130 TaxID=1357510 RepID=A0ABR8G0M1_9NOSO|nr:NAD(P)-binding protein [Nostoc spongiaeforme]MBD2596763.1 NAD(P)-binding protein [Nostoc spongiaeforme FACHB-130]